MARTTLQDALQALRDQIQLVRAGSKPAAEKRLALRELRRARRALRRELDETEDPAAEAAELAEEMDDAFKEVRDIGKPENAATYFPPGDAATTNASVAAFQESAVLLRQEMGRLAEDDPDQSVLDQRKIRNRVTSVIDQPHIPAVLNDWVKTRAREWWDLFTESPEQQSIADAVSVLAAAELSVAEILANVRVITAGVGKIEEA